MKMNKLTGLTLLSLLSYQAIQAQQSTVYTSPTADFTRALELYQQEQYHAAQVLFTKVKYQTKSQEIQSDCAYYIANCAIYLDQQGADSLMEDFVMNYPTSIKQNSAYRQVGEYYFNQGDYEQAISWFEKVDEASLTQVEKDKYYFQKGYTLFNRGDRKAAQKYFAAIEKSETYGTQAKYYLGYMAYEGDNYKEADTYFQEVAAQEQYKDKLSYIQADMNFKSGNFQKAIEEGLKELPKASAAEKSEVNKIIGESYFNLNQYQEAIPYLEKYTGKAGKWSNTDFYQLGYAHYKQGSYQKAIDQFNKIISGQDHIAQNAYYHLGESYLKLNQKPQALNAFKNASEMNFDIKIQEDAHLNYAKLSYEIGNNYQSVPSLLAGFMEKYPNNPNNAELQNLLINSYITSKNFKEAFTLLEKNKSAINAPAYQKVAFYRGLELYADGNYQEALTYFKKSIAEPRDPQFVARATFWRAETEYVLSNFQEALVSFQQFEGNAQAEQTPEYANLNYNLGYAFFKLKDYTQAADKFQAYINGKVSDPTRRSDAYLRLADSYFVSGKYWPAMEAYNKAIELKGPDLDYASYQKAISYGFVERTERKIEELQAFVSKFPKSQYHDDALYELANTYTNSQKNKEALATYDKLIQTYPNGNFVSKAILRQGLIYYNSENDDQALAKFKKVAADFPSSPEALQAVSTAKNIYVDAGRVEEYASWVKTLSYIEVSDAELDKTTFESAEKQYLQNNKKAAIAGFSSYLSKFPSGLSSLKAEFYLAELYTSDNLPRLAQPLYEKVIARSRNEFTEQALVRLSAIHLKDEAYQKAIPVLKRLETEAEFPQNTLYAQSNLMRSYYLTDDFSNTVVYAEKVLANSKTDNKVKSDAQIMIARSAMKTGDVAKAKSAYKNLETIAQGELAAEALYYDAYFKNLDKKYDQSNQVIQKLTKDYSGYKYFGVKGLIVMAKNFYALNDSFQATHILESVVKNFTEFEDVVNEASTELAKIKAEEAKRNSSVKH